MATYAITTKSTLYTVYQIEADTVAEAIHTAHTQKELRKIDEWTEVSHHDIMELDEETED